MIGARYGVPDSEARRFGGRALSAALDGICSTVSARRSHIIRVLPTIAIPEQAPRSPLPYLHKVRPPAQGRATQACVRLRYPTPEHAVARQSEIFPPRAECSVPRDHWICVSTPAALAPSPRGRNRAPQPASARRAGALCVPALALPHSAAIAAAKHQSASWAMTPALPWMRVCGQLRHLACCAASPLGLSLLAP